MIEMGISYDILGNFLRYSWEFPNIFLGIPWFSILVHLAREGPNNRATPTGDACRNPMIEMGKVESLSAIDLPSLHAYLINLYKRLDTTNDYGNLIITSGIAFMLHKS